MDPFNDQDSPGLRFGVSGLGFRVWGKGSEIQGLVFMVQFPGLLSDVLGYLSLLSPARLTSRTLRPLPLSRSPNSAIRYFRTATPELLSATNSVKQIKYEKRGELFFGSIRNKRILSF